MTRAVRSSVHYFITASENLRNKSRFLWGWMYDDEQRKEIPVNWEVIPNTVIKREQNNSIMRAILNVTPEERMFLCCGEFADRKGFMNAIEAFEKLRGDYSRSLYINGDGPLRKELFKRANESKALIRITNSDPYVMISACNVLVVPSLYDEDFPNVVLIAMMYGKPVIASDVGGMIEMVVSGGEKMTGKLVKAGDVDQLSREMKILCDSTPLRVALGENAKERFEREYNNEKIMGRYIELWTR